SAGAGPVLDDELLAEELTELRRHLTRDEVVASARAGRDDDTHRLRRIRLRGRRAGNEQREQKNRDTPCFHERSTCPAAAPVSAPRSHVTAPLTIVYSMPCERITMRFAPPGRS